LFRERAVRLAREESGDYHNKTAALTAISGK
jgi:hypothetical protein